MPPISALLQQPVEHTLYLIIKHHTALGINANELEIVLQIAIHQAEYPRQNVDARVLAQALNTTPYRLSYYVSTLKKKRLLQVTIEYDPQTGKVIRDYTIATLLEKLNELAEVEHE